MLAPEFVSVYPRVCDTPLYNDDMDQVVWRAIEFSEKFGVFLYDRLLHPTRPLSSSMPELDDLMEEYRIFGQNELDATYDLVAQSTNPKALKARHLLDFHRINLAMLPLWSAVIEPGLIGSQELNDSIPVMQDALSIKGFQKYLDRQPQTEGDAHFAYFSNEYRTLRINHEGTASELDFAVVALQIMLKNRGMLLLPAPHQFELDNYNKDSYWNSQNRNVDFIALNSYGRAVGIQLKTVVFSDHVEIYDPKRVVLVDGQIDMGNQLAVRTRPEGNKAIVTWSGLIAAHRVLGFSTLGQRGLQLRGLGLDDQAIKTSQQTAELLVGNIKPYIDTATKIISSRILHRI